MRKITKLAIEALINGNNYSCDNTQVSNSCMYLHGSKIAELVNGDFIVSTRGWNTKTTLERLNGLPGVRVNIKKGVLFLNGEPWDGQPVAIPIIVGLGKFP